MSSKIKQNSRFELIIIALVAFVCLGISFYQTTLGYKEAFGSILISGAFALVVVSLLFYLNFRLRAARRNSLGAGAIGGILTLYFIFTFASFAGNFNAFYTNFMKDELVKTELVQKRDNLNKLQEDAKAALSSQEALRPKIEGLTVQLESQIRNPSEPGCGEKCEKILSQIEGLLDTPITRLKGDNKEMLIREYKKIIAKELDVRLRVVNDESRKELISQINKEAAALKPKMEDALQNPSVSGIATLKEIVDKYKEIGNKTKKLVGESFKYDEEIKVENEEIGKISQTFSSASKNVNHWGSWLSAIISLFIDLFVPMFILFITAPNSSDRFRTNRYEPREA